MKTNNKGEKRRKKIKFETFKAYRMKPKSFDENGNSIKHTIPNPSEKFLDGGSILSIEKRKRIIDIAAKQLDTNTYGAFGRSAMCMQFSILIKHLLMKEGIPSEMKIGTAIYTGAGEKHKWEHSWVEMSNGEIIDCNVDSMIYHYDVPNGIEPHNYWGQSNALPSDRTFLTSQVFTSEDITQLEKEDNETVLWKLAIDKEF